MEISSGGHEVARPAVGVEKPCSQFHEPDKESSDDDEEDEILMPIEEEDFDEAKDGNKTWGTFLGVFVPCLQNLLGVVLFVRLPFVVGQAGVLVSLGIVGLANLSSFLTILSLSALVTNGRVRGGGPYGILFKNLGPEFAGSIGLLFYAANVLAASLYTLGGVEVIYTSFVTGQIDFEIFAFDRQVFAILWTLALGAIVIAGMRWITKAAVGFLAIVVLALTFMFVGAILFAANAWNPDGVIRASSPRENLYANYTEDPVTGQSTSFAYLLALFYPSVTDVMAGCNLSAVLTNPSRSIPAGTLAAFLITLLIQIATVLLFGLSVSQETLDLNKQVSSSIGWPTPFLIAAGVLLSTVGAGLQSLTSAPQLLRQIASDGQIGILDLFATRKPSSEPRLAILVTSILSALVCLAGNLDYIAPLVTIFFLIMYAAINLACFLSAIVKSPAFRPTWRYFHWSTALVGFSTCFVFIFLTSLLYAFITLTLVILLFLYVRYRQNTKEWGDAIFGLRLAIARSALISLTDLQAAGKEETYSLDLSEGVVGQVCEEARLAEEEEEETTDRSRWSSFFDRVQGSKGLTRRFPASGGALKSFDGADVDWSSFREAGNGYFASQVLSRKNWRPQILVLCKLRLGNAESAAGMINENVSEGIRVTRPVLLQVASQLKKGRGLTIVVSVLRGNLQGWDAASKWAASKQYLQSELRRHKLKGFADVVLSSSEDPGEAIRIMFQSKGLGLLTPNTIMVSWPSVWKQHTFESRTDHDLAGQDSSTRQLRFVQMLKDALWCQKALIVVKFAKHPPSSDIVAEKLIDVWWLIHDGDILVLIPYMLQRHKVWTKSRIRIFTVADEFIDPVASEKLLRNHLERVRINAEIKVLNIATSHARSLAQNRTIFRDMKKSGTSQRILSKDMFRNLQDDETQSNVGFSSISSSFDTIGTVERNNEETYVPTGKEARIQPEVLNRFVNSHPDRNPFIEFEHNASQRRKTLSGSDPSNLRIETAIMENNERTWPRFHRKIKKSSPREIRFSRQLKRLKTAAYLNELILSHSENSSLVIVNLPLTRKSPHLEFIKYTEELTQGLNRVIMIRGTGLENVSDVG